MVVMETARGIPLVDGNTVVNPIATPLNAMANGLNTALDDLEENIKFPYRVGTNAERLALAGADLFEGLKFRTTDTKLEYVYTGLTWLLTADNRIIGRVNRSATASTFPSANYTNVGTNTFWVNNTAEGIAAYNGGWTIPETGWYSVSYEMRANGGFVSGVSVNYTSTSPLLFLAATSGTIQTVAAATVTGSMKLNKNDVIRPYLLASSGNPSWVPNVGFFSLEWIRA